LLYLSIASWDITLSSKITLDKSVQYHHTSHPSILLLRFPFRVVCGLCFPLPQTARVLPWGLDNLVCLYDVTTRRQDMCALSHLTGPAVARYPQHPSTLARV
jgi:hypothetical protein